MFYLTNHDKDGRILSCFESGDLAQLELNKSEFHVLEKSNYEIDYVKDGKVTARPTQSTQLKGAVLSKLPVPCTLNINGEVYEVDESTIKLDFDQPTTYKIVVSSFPYLDKEFTYENT